MNIAKEFPAFEAYKGANFTSGRLEVGGLWRQYRNASLAISLFLSCFSCAEEENGVEEIWMGFLNTQNETTEE